MKNSIDILFIFFFTCASLFCEAQVFPAYEENPIWKTEYISVVGNGEETHLAEAPVWQDGFWWTPIFRDQGQGAGLNFIHTYYRQEGQQVFIGRPNVVGPGVNSTLMYDFSLSVGDSVFCASPGYGDLALYHVLETDTVYCGDILRKKMWVMGQITNELVYYTIRFGLKA